VQKLPRGLVRFAYPRSRFGLSVRALLDKVLTSRLFAPVAAKLTQVAETDRALPEIRSSSAA
jgi:hypothetical protein